MYAIIKIDWQNNVTWACCTPGPVDRWTFTNALHRDVFGNLEEAKHWAQNLSQAEGETCYVVVL